VNFSSCSRSQDLAMRSRKCLLNVEMRRCHLVEFKGLVAVAEALAAGHRAELQKCFAGSSPQLSPLAVPFTPAKKSPQLPCRLPHHCVVTSTGAALHVNVRSPSEACNLPVRVDGELPVRVTERVADAELPFRAFFGGSDQVLNTLRQPRGPRARVPVIPSSARAAVHSTVPWLEYSPPSYASATAKKLQKPRSYRAPVSPPPPSQRNWCMFCGGRDQVETWGAA
jgi:hypothetical protein